MADCQTVMRCLVVGSQCGGGNLAVTSVPWIARVGEEESWGRGAGCPCSGCTVVG